MTKKEQVKEFINNLDWKTQMESGERYAIIFDEKRLDMSEMSFRKYANALGYSVYCNDMINLTITLKGHKIYN